MQSQSGLKRDTCHRKYFMGAHPIIHTYMEKLGLTDIIGSHIKQDLRGKLSNEKTIGLVVHNIRLYPDFSTKNSRDNSGLAVIPRPITVCATCLESAQEY